MNPKALIALSGLVAAALTACASPQAPVERQPGGGSPAIQRTLVIGARGQPPTLAAKPLVSFSGSLQEPKTLFNATLDYPDERGVNQPILQEVLPQLNTDSWKVMPDGTMETVYHLKPNLTWHDGQPLSADDFAFAWQVYSTPPLGVSGTTPLAQMREVVASDPRTVVIRWRVPYPNAASLGDGFQALPRHILEQAFHRPDPVAFTNHPFWGPEYVGLGPYRLTHVEPGAYIEGEAFDGYVLGRPKIDKVQVRFIPDPNTAVANLLSGDVNYMGQYVLDASNGQTLEDQWGAKGGQVFWAPVQPRINFVQLRPDVVQPRALLDLRVRRAMAYGMDSVTALEVLSGGRGLVMSSITSPKAPYYPEIDRIATRYPYDPRSVQQSLEAADYHKGPDGIFATASGERLAVGLWTSSGAKNEHQGEVFVDGLKRAGVDATPNVIPAAAVTDQSVRALAPGLHIETGPTINPYEQFTSAAIPSADNLWKGNNLAGWVSPEYDRFYDAYTKGLDPNQRVQAIAGMERTFREDLGSIPLYFDAVVTARTSNLEGPVARETPDSAQDYRNVQLWHWTS